MPRKDLSLKEKINILRQIKNLPSKTPLRQLEKILNLSKTTISRLIKQQNELEKQWINAESQTEGLRKRRRVGKDPEVDAALNSWFYTSTQKGICVSGPMLKLKAKELAVELGHENFKVTEGWLSRWKTRHNVKLKKAHSEKDSTNLTEGEKCKKEKIPELAKEIFTLKENTDEVFPKVNFNHLLDVDANVDVDLKCCNNNKDYQSIIVNEYEIELDFKEEENSDEEICRSISIQEAEKSIDILRHFFMQIGNEDSPFEALDKCAEYVRKK